MKAVVVDVITLYGKIGKVWNLDEKEIIDAVNKVAETGEDVELKIGGRIVKVWKDKHRVYITEYYPNIRSIVLTKEYFKKEYSDIIKYMKENQPVKKKELEKEFVFKAKRFINEAKGLGLLKRTNKGYVLEGV